MRTGALSRPSTSLKTSSQFWPLLYPGAKLTKLRHRLRPVLGIPLSVDEFQGNLKGLVIAEAEFDNPEKLARFAMPDFAVREVTAVLFSRAFTWRETVYRKTEGVQLWELRPRHSPSCSCTPNR